MAIKWQGMEKLVATISNAQPKAVDQSLKVLKNNGEKGKRIAKQLAPKDTEFLKDHITTSYPGMEAHIHGEAGYEGYQEYGTRFQPGTPHFRPMMEQIQPQFQKDMTDVMKGAFK
ncbi:HK97-gp10 family putative phage morphogenesis protein [Streptococcus suis]|uniref:HK97-gp10 family putative phage morphogenesis protein n=1 Tax=Streptococcus suis TaxID=1307 RepID=UPI0005C8786C|nr:HK97-gp10 family putative phage morphogenesis protein [Streptococcus suis]CYY65901.1 phage protein%2C HK97 gp10 family [Streptococcus suis]CYY87888.1 phage protein%2C HK97 gp10 family [Streptococcus suis]